MCKPSKAIADLKVNQGKVGGSVHEVHAYWLMAYRAIPGHLWSMGRINGVSPFTEGGEVLGTTPKKSF